jgi:hypothetical protein
MRVKCQKNDRRQIQKLKPKYNASLDCSFTGLSGSFCH